MAAITRVSSVDVASPSFMAIDLVVWGALLAAVWSRMRDRVPPRFWWSTLVAAALFAPAISTIFWLQPNLIVFGLALAGFVLVGRRDPLGGFLIRLSIALQPIVILFPLALLSRRPAREAGLWPTAPTAALAFRLVGLAPRHVG